MKALLPFHGGATDVYRNICRWCQHLAGLDFVPTLPVLAAHLQGPEQVSEVLAVPICLLQKQLYEQDMDALEYALITHLQCLGEQELDVLKYAWMTHLQSLGEQTLMCSVPAQNICTSVTCRRRCCLALNAIVVSNG